MCGLFGFKKLDRSKTPSPRKVARIARAMDSRGGHAVGWINGYQDTSILTEPAKHEGLASSVAGIIRTDVVGTNVMVGHTRFATHGTSSNDDNLHPHEYENEYVYGAITHNGVISGHEETASRLDLELKGECDSEIIARLIESYDGLIPYHERVADAINECDNGSCIALGCVETDGDEVRFVLASRGNPVCYQLHHGILYYASTKEALPNADRSLRLSEGSILYSNGDSFEVVAGLLNKIEQSFGFANWQSYRPIHRVSPRLNSTGLWEKACEQGDHDSFDDWVASRSCR